MRAITRTFLAAAAATTAALTPSAAQAQTEPTQVRAVETSGTHEAYWGRAGGGWQLFVDGERTRLKLPAARLRILPDLGTDTNGKDLAVVYHGGKGLRVFNVRTGRDRAVAGAPKTAFAPSIDKGKVAFALPVAKGPDRIVAPSGERTQPVTGTSDEADVTGLELSGRHLAITTVESYNEDETSKDLLWYDRTRLAFGQTSVNQGSTFSQPFISGTKVGAAFVHVGDGGYYSTLIRVDRSTRKGEHADLGDTFELQDEQTEPTETLQSAAPRGSSEILVAATQSDSDRTILQRPAARWRSGTLGATVSKKG